MKSISRRSFVGHAVAGAAAFAAPGMGTSETTLLYKPGDWHMGSFHQLLNHRFEVKQLFDAAAVDDGNVLEHMVNSLNGLQFGFGIPAAEIKIVGAFRSQATVLNLDDVIWEKYHLGATMKINDPKTGKPATRNPFAKSAAGDPPKYRSSDPDDDDSAFQDTSMQALRARGVQFLACHLAMSFFAKRTVEKQKLKQTRQEVLDDFTAHLLPGVLVVPSMVSAIPLLQSKGKFSYIRM